MRFIPTSPAVILLILVILVIMLGVFAFIMWRRHRADERTREELKHMEERLDDIDDDDT